MSTFEKERIVVSSMTAMRSYIMCVEQNRHCVCLMKSVLFKNTAHDEKHKINSYSHSPYLGLWYTVYGKSMCVKDIYFTTEQFEGKQKALQYLTVQSWQFSICHIILARYNCVNCVFFVFSLQWQYQIQLNFILWRKTISLKTVWASVWHSYLSTCQQHDDYIA